MLVTAIVCHTDGAFALKYCLLKVGIYRPILPNARRNLEVLGVRQLGRRMQWLTEKVVDTTCKSCHGGCGVWSPSRTALLPTSRATRTPRPGHDVLQGPFQHPARQQPGPPHLPAEKGGQKGEGKWKRISWDEALDTIAGKMKDSIEKYGPSSIAVSQGTGRGYNEYTHRFARSIGTANIITPGYVCHSPRLGLYGLVTGYGRLYCDYHGWGGEFPKTQISWAKQLEISSADSEMAVWFMNSLNYCQEPDRHRPPGQRFPPGPRSGSRSGPGTDCRPGAGHDERHHQRRPLGQGVRGELDLRLRQAQGKGPGIHAGDASPRLPGPKETDHPSRPAVRRRYARLHPGRQLAGAPGQLRPDVAGDHLPAGRSPATSRGRAAW